MSNKYTANAHVIYDHFTDTDGSCCSIVIIPNDRVMIIHDSHIDQYDLSDGTRYYAVCDCEAVVDLIDDYLYTKVYMPVKHINACGIITMEDGHKYAEWNDFCNCNYLKSLDGDDDAPAKLIPFKEALFDDNGALKVYVALEAKTYVDDTVLPAPDMLMYNEDLGLVLDALEYAVEQTYQSNGEVEAFGPHDFYDASNRCEVAHTVENLIAKLRTVAEHGGALIYSTDTHDCKVFDK